MPYIFVVDDSPQERALLIDMLSSEGAFEVDQARSGKEALDLLEAGRLPDLIILDIMMPVMNGLELCRRLRGDPRFASLPILFLTARGRSEDVVEGLDAGGDDYVVKPFKPAELLARVRALLRRTHRDEDQSAILEVRDLKLDTDTYQVYRGEEPIQLTATEYRLLHYLMTHANQPLSPQHLLTAVWDYPSGTGDPDLVRVHVRNLRAKIELDASDPRYIFTVHGVGYVIRE